MLKRMRLLGAALFRRDAFEREMADEMRFHMQAYADDLERSGMPREEAERRARIEFGGFDTAREDARQARGLQLFDETRQDLRFAARQMLKTPGFTAAVVISLALGIGANTAIFSLMDAVMFRTLPIANPDALFYLAHSDGAHTSASSNYPLMDRYRGADVFSGITSYERRGFTIATPDGLEQATGQYVSGNYHAVIGAPLAFGRGFSSEPDRPDGRAPIAVISDGYWERKFGRSQDVIGRTLNIGGRRITIVGVTAPGFHGLVAGARLDVTLPLSIRALDEPEFLGARNGWVSFTLVGRLEPDVTSEETRAAADAVFLRFWMEPDNAWARGEDGKAIRHAVLRPAGKGSYALRERYARPLRVLMGLVGIVLLIACVNVANLLFARGTARAKEVAVRLSIGAGRGRVVRQLVTESLVLAGFGGALGLLVAVASTQVVLSLFNTGQAPIALDVALNARVLAFTTAVCVVTGVVFGLLPAIKATRVDLTPTLKDGGVVTGRRSRLTAGKTLVAAQIALCMVMIATAGLLVRSLHNLRTIDGGFIRENVLLFRVETYSPPMPDERRIAIYSEVLDRLKGLPGVVSAALGERSPIDFSSQRRRIEIPGFAVPAGAGVSANVVTPEYFSTFGIGLVRGRLLTPADRVGSTNVLVVGESMAREFFRGADPIGRTVVIGGNKMPMTIVGIVRDVRHEELRESPPPMVYMPLAQPVEAFDGSTGYPAYVNAVIRTAGDPRTIAASARQIVSAVSRDVPVVYVRTMEQQLDAALVRERLLANFSGGFGLLALLLAFVGLYGVMSYNVARRAREMGIRIALGATRSRVLRQILREAMSVSSAGIVIGLAGALAVTKLISAFLFGLTPRDPITLTSVAAMLLATALAAGYFPARRASATDPLQAIKAE